VESLTLEDARKVIAAAEKKAVEIDCPMDIAVVDAGGNLKAHVRMDGALIGSIDISIDEAYAAIAFQAEKLFSLDDAADGRVVVFCRRRTLET
jgi:uncharacterized protein GlcG (DUF336 family)